ncbi:MAG: N-acetyltransferase [Williamsia sp.]|nr:N-acetyltransferase [Williamsia sp.]
MLEENRLLIREAIEQDLPAILEIYNHSIQHTTAVYDYKPHTMDMRRTWFAQKRADGQPVLVALKDGAIAGFASYGPFRPWAAYKYTVENSIHVHPRFRGQGVGKQLLAVTIEKAKQADVHVIIAGIDATNQVSIRLHTSFGFERAGCFREVGFKFNRWLDLEFYQLLLQTPEHPAE